ncbi:MAG TPA: transketolase [Candidatus Moranbacteria bacterium]|nr:transketolase [Candidatus Moranbacteria bacterium]
MKNLSNAAELELTDIFLRRWILRMTTAAGSGHPTSSLSAVEAMSVLLFGRDERERPFFRFDPTEPENPANDRLIFSKGHAAPLYYALWAAAGFIAPSELMTLRRFDSVLEGHPTRRFPLTEVPTGSLGQGLSVGLGMALLGQREKNDRARVFVLVGDGEMAEGQIWEAFALASYYNLSNLKVLVDVNRLGQCGQTMLGWRTDEYLRRARSFGWQAWEVDGADRFALAEAWSLADRADRPSVIFAKTRKGQGVSFLADADGWHGKALAEADLACALAELPETKERKPPVSLAGPLPLRRNSSRPSREEETHPATVEKVARSRGEKAAVRDAYGTALAELVAQREEVVVLDAETSNSTCADRAREVCPERFFEMFIAEQNMVSAAVGMARRGKHPFVSTFAAFITRAADQIRMAQYAEVPITFVGSHPGVSIGADGSSQMGLEDLALFGALRESVIFYPADATTMDKVVKLAADCPGISYIRSTRATLPVIYADEDFVVGGSRVHLDTPKDVAAIVAAGVTLHEALVAADDLAKEGISCRVLDLYCLRPLDKEALRAAAETGLIVAVEDHYERGGLGQAVGTFLAAENIDCDFRHLFVSRPPRSGTTEQLLAYERIDAEAIKKTVREALSER